MESENYEEQNPPETGAIMMTPGETFCVDIEVSTIFISALNLFCNKVSIIIK